jgi:hypothetical protein
MRKHMDDWSVINHCQILETRPIRQVDSINDRHETQLNLSTENENLH